MVLHHGDGMSKSKGNLVELGPTIEEWGADAVRLAMMFAGPIEDDMEYDTVSVAGVHRWLGRVWRTVHEAAEVDGAGASTDGDAAEDLRRFTHRTIKAATGDFDRYHFNLAISRLMTLTTELRRALDQGRRGPAIREAAETLVRVLAPIAPHVAEELWAGPLAHGDTVIASGWPQWDETLAREEEVVMVVQVDGKVRDRITVSPQATEDECRDLAVGSQRVKSYLDGRSIDRVVVKPPRLVNIVTRPS
jgi:leucyl-tRNA synthetase